MSGVMRKDSIWTKYVRGSIGVVSILDKKGEKRQRWFEYVMRKKNNKSNYEN